MGTFDWKSTIKANIFKLRLAGLWPKNDETYKLDIYLLWTVIVFAVFICPHNFFQTVEIFFLDDLTTITSMICYKLTHFLGTLKAYYVFQNMPILKELMIILRSDIFQPKNERQRKLVEPNLKFWKNYYIVYWTMTAISVSLWTITPYLDGTWKNHRLPYLAWYPFDTSVSPNYELTYLHQAITLILMSFSTMGVDTLVNALTMHTRCQMENLCDNLRNLKVENFDKDLIMCTEHHLEICRFAASSNTFFGWIIFFQFFTSGMSIGITLFQMNVVVLLSNDFYPLLIFELGIIVEILMFCWFGNELEEQSKQITYAAFESAWTDAPLGARKSLIIFMANCQAPLKTTSSFGLFNLSLETFITILKASWSYFTLLSGITSSN